MKRLRMRLLRPGAEMPARETAGSAGFDIRACLEREIVIPPGQTAVVGSGFAVELEPGYAAFIYARSGLGIKGGIVPANCVGVIDSDYRGEVKIGLRNHSGLPFPVRNGDRIAQMVISKCETPEIELCDSLSETARGGKGFGSSGIRETPDGM
ncbi:MAG: dUTP diphosphatase [Oscillospiraceae bacterium]|jgi:dUTP pyrophosphatase|nr:dUTP diphosphatase [Oscillospiraceae bacterium]